MYIEEVADNIYSLGKKRNWITRPVNLSYVYVATIQGENVIIINFNVFHPKLIISYQIFTSGIILGWLKERIIEYYPEYKGSCYKLYLKKGESITDFIYL